MQNEKVRGVGEANNFVKTEKGGKKKPCG